MRQDKEYIFKLRQEGKSYREIQKETGVSRATLGAWFKDVEWSKHILVANKEKNLQECKERVFRMNKGRKIRLKDQYDKAEAEAALDYETYKKEALFWAGLMAYAGEGDKRNKSLMRITNSEFYIHTIFIKFILKYMDISRETLRIGLLIYPDHNESFCREMWSNILGVPRSQFYKTQVLQGKAKVKRLQYGIGMSIISNTVLKKKLLVWLSLAQDERFEDAVIV